MGFLYNVFVNAGNRVFDNFCSAAFFIEMDRTGTSDYRVAVAFVFHRFKALQKKCFSDTESAFFFVNTGGTEKPAESAVVTGKAEYFVCPFFNGDKAGNGKSCEGNARKRTPRHHPYRSV